MSAHNLEAFIEDAIADPNLQGRLETISEETDWVDEFVNLGIDRGYSFSKQDLLE